MSDKCGSCKHDGTVRFNTNGTTDCMKCDKKDIHNVGPCTDYRPAVEPEGGGKDVLKVDETIRNCGKRPTTTLTSKHRTGLNPEANDPTDF